MVRRPGNICPGRMLAGCNCRRQQQRREGKRTGAQPSFVRSLSRGAKLTCHDTDLRGPWRADR